MPHHTRVQFLKVLLVLLAGGLPLHGQCEPKSLAWPEAPAYECLADTFATNSAERPVEVGKGSLQANSEPLLFPSPLADNVKVDAIANPGWIRQKSACCEEWTISQQRNSELGAHQPGIADVSNDIPTDLKIDSGAVVRPRNQPSVDRGVYYRNKLEFAFDAGYLPINIPFVFDVFMGDAYNMTGLKYTLVPIVASLRWQLNDVGGPWILRGNWDMTASGSVTAIPRGPETRYFSYDMGIRRNFVPRRGKIAPYFDGRLGLGEIDAKEPLGVQFAQGQNFTFTVNMGAGTRYNFNPRYSISAGLNWMHISNLYLSEPAFSNYGINVWGPMFGIDIRLSKPRPGSR